MALLVARATRSTRPPRGNAITSEDPTPIRLVWLNQRGPGGGGGGGGNQMPQPPRRVEAPGRDARTVPAATPRAVESAPKPAEREPVPEVIAPIATLALGTTVLPGAIDAPPAAPSTSQGPGRDGGAGTGVGPGDGPGRGRGVGNGFDQGIGGDIYQIGVDVTAPVELRKGIAQYTTEAMRARAQGAVVVECVVQTTGVCTNIRVMRSFDPSFGLDQEAIKAAAQWRFRPGMRRGQPVPVRVTMEIAFALR